MPKAMHGMPKATFQALSFLNFVFIKDLSDLHKYLLVLPNSAYAPDLLILDDSLEAFVDNQLKVDWYFVHHAMQHYYLAHVIKQPNFRIPNPQYLQRNFCFDFFNDSENRFRKK